MKAEESVNQKQKIKLPDESARIPRIQCFQFQNILNLPNRTFDKKNLKQNHKISNSVKPIKTDSNSPGFFWTHKIDPLLKKIKEEANLLFVETNAILKKEKEKSLFFLKSRKSNYTKNIESEKNDLIRISAKKESKLFLIEQNPNISITKTTGEFKECKNNFMFSLECQNTTIKVLNYRTNQKSKYSFSNLIENLDKFFDNFVKNITGNTLNVTESFKRLIDYDEIDFKNVINAIFFDNKQMLHKKLSKDLLVKFMSENYDCSEIEDWIIGFKKRKSLPKLLKKHRQNLTKSFLIKNLKSRPLELSANEINKKINMNFRFYCDNKLTSNLPAEEESSTSLNFFFSIIYYVYSKLYEHFFNSKFESIKNAYLKHQKFENLVENLGTQRKANNRLLNQNQKNALFRELGEVNIQDFISPVKINFENLDLILAKHSIIQADAISLYTNYLKEAKNSIFRSK